MTNWPLAFRQPAGFGTAFKLENDLHTLYVALSVLSVSIRSHSNRARGWKAHLFLGMHVPQGNGKHTFKHMQKSKHM